MTTPAFASSSAIAATPVTNVLVVDDVAENLLAMEALLQRHDLRVLKAASGAEALELLLVEDVALALLDVQMPGMDGFTLAELMRGAERTRGVPIIFLTASPGDPLRSFRGYETGAVDFLHKPIDTRMILGKVDVFVELHRQRLLQRTRNEELERLLKLNETMIAVLTHDLRTPLTAIMMYADALRLPPDPERVGKMVDGLETSARRMARMISQLLDFSRIRSDVLRLQCDESDLAAVATATILELRQARPQARIELSAEGDLQGVFDADCLTQVLSNLISNALQYGTPHQPVRVLLDGHDPTRLRASVVNAGQVPQELLSRIFEPFKRAVGQRSEGLGLGLFIVDQFVRAHGGEVSAASNADEVVFTFSLLRRPPGVHAVRRDEDAIAANR